MNTLLFRSLLQCIIGYEWLHAGWGKVSEGTFAGGLSGTLTKFASQNPYPWYTRTILEPLTRHSETLGQWIQWGELLAGIALIASALVYTQRIPAPWKKTTNILLAIALLGTILMSANFYLAAGWTSASTKGLNTLLFWIEVLILADVVYLFVKKKV